MKKTYEVISKIPQYKLFREYNYPRILPLNLTVSITYHCNSRCKTCNVWKKRTDEFTTDEFDKTFKSIGRSPYWLTISGGEPFLRDDIVEICHSAYNHFKPGIINIPTNGILYNTIPGKVEEIIKSCTGTKIIINLSIDGIGERHDYIRNVKNNFKKALRTYEALRALDYPDFSLGIHTVISNYNVSDISQIYNYFIDKSPDSYITEIAEERVELDTVGTGITPSVEDYTKSIDFLINQVEQGMYSGIPKVMQAFRLEYYNHVKATLRKKQQILPCYAGFASAHIAPDGDVWTCCIKADPIGNVREVDYDFKKVWFNSNAYKQRKSIKNKECYCPMANAHYTNMLCNLGTLVRVGMRAV
ncbi:putative Fe-S oxidoreductase [Candidatus Methanoperedens nitroreducens]|uniref:Putative Fe-S oxidoreductase n=1 Tax=Candidatus Methanoperedens nitratireducens TaxID=1392998 RepID=A0A062V4P8_9EURY|nr:radical SAM protein [Candidatus Methanoperedens nitroreducens]KCZ70789.1 putative Fe-S oxidoreductase [Candidatus Methanoperedens nitroreducens]MDJ1420644.1 radical SAM protein [Candidatus Methanoperedens sp.]